MSLCSDKSDPAVPGLAVNQSTLQVHFGLSRHKEMSCKSGRL